MKIGRLSITASRWPWQIRRSSGLFSCPKTEKVGAKYGWMPTGGMGRFGGGWKWSLGINVGGSTVILDLLFGSIRFSIKPKETNI